MYTLSCHVEFSFSYHDWARPAVLQFFISIFIITDQMDSSARARSLSISFLCMFCVSPSCGRCQKEPLAWKILPSTKCFALHLTFAHTSCEPLLLFIGCNPLSTKQMPTCCYCVCVLLFCMTKGGKNLSGAKHACDTLDLWIWHAYFVTRAERKQPKMETRVLKLRNL